MNKKMMNNKIAKGIVSLTIIVVLLLSVLAGSFYYQNNITANAVKEVSADFDKDISIKEIDAKNLNQLNEGWYKTINGNLFYLERFDKPVYLYARIDNPEYKNEIFSVDSDGNLEFFGNNSLNNGNNKLKSTYSNRISGNVVGMESVSGMQSAPSPTEAKKNQNLQALGLTDKNINKDGTYTLPNLNGKFIVNNDGSIYFAPNTGAVSPPQTFDSGKFYYAYDNSAAGQKAGQSVPVNLQPLSEKTKNDNIAALDLTRNTDGTYKNVKYPGSYTIKDDGSIFYSGDKNNPPETYVNGNWYKIDGTLIPLTARPLNLGGQYVMPSPPPSADFSELLPQPVTPINVPQFTAAISSYGTEIQAAYNKYPPLRNYPGIIEQIIAAESGGSNSASGDGGKSVGLMQINTADSASRKGYTVEQLNDPANNIDAGAQKILEIISDKNFKGSREQIIFGYNQKNVPSIEAINSKDPDKIYPNIDSTTAQNLYDTRSQAAQLTQLTNLKPYTALLNGQLVQIGVYASQQDALNAVKGIQGITQVQAQTAAVQGTYNYNIFDSSNQFIGTVTANDIGGATSAGQMLARLKNKEFGSAEQPKFQMSNSITGVDMTIPANSESEARDIYKQQFGVYPDSTKKLMPGSTGTAINYNLVDKTGQKIITITSNSEEEAQALLKNYQSYDKYKDAGLKLEKVPTLADLRKDNPGVPDNILQLQLQNLLSTGSAAQQNELKAPAYYAVKKDGKEIGWYVNGVPYNNKADAEAAFRKANSDYETAAQARYANDPKILQGRTVLNEKTPDNQLISHDTNGVYIFVPTLDDQKVANGGRWVPIASPTYQRQTTIGQGANAVTITENVDVKTRKIVGGSFEQGNQIISLDTATINQMKNGAVNPRIISSEKGKDQVFEFTNPQTGLISHITTNPSTGYREEQTIRNTYFDDNGKPLSNSQVQQRLKDKSLPPPVRETLQSKSTENGQTYITNFNYRTEKIDGQNVRVADGVQVDQTTGKMVGFVYSELDQYGSSRRLTFDSDGKIIKRELVGLDGRVIVGQDRTFADLDNRGNTARSQEKSREFFEAVQYIFTEFRGLGYIPSLFGFDDDKLIEWRNGVDKVFSTLYLGTEYWSSKICTATAGLANENEGIAYAETPQGMAQIGAHIEATRTQPIVTENGTSYIYKITFQVRNGDYEKDERAPENMSINVFIIPNGQGISSGIQIFKQDVHIGRGSSFGRFGTNAIVQESTNLYDKICIKFDKIPLKWKIKDNTLCNKIEDNTYSQPTALQQRNAARQGTNTDMNNW
mgnify:FL=1